jgi:hypothetical protein
MTSNGTYDAEEAALKIARDNFQHDSYAACIPILMILCAIALIVNTIILCTYLAIGASRLTPTLRLTLGLGWSALGVQAILSHTCLQYSSTYGHLY